MANPVGAMHTGLDRPAVTNVLAGSTSEPMSDVHDGHRPAAAVRC